MDLQQIDTVTFYLVYTTHIIYIRQHVHTLGQTPSSVLYLAQSYKKYLRQHLHGLDTTPSSVWHQWFLSISSTKSKDTTSIPLHAQENTVVVTSYQYIRCQPRSTVPVRWVFFSLRLPTGALPTWRKAQSQCLAYHHGWLTVAYGSWRWHMTPAS